MIAGVRGRVLRVEAGGVFVTVGPVDVRVAVPATTALSLSPGQEVALRTHLYVREDQLALFGFDSDAALEIFELLLSVSGIGPKAALGVLSALSPGEVRQAISDGDARALTRAPGVGQRAASRIVTDLQGKVGPSPADMIEIGRGPTGAAIEALMSMGYSAPEAKRAVDRVAAHESVEDILRAALAALSEH